MAKGRGGLGRGLESLFEDAAPSFESDTRIETLPLREIEPDPGQPRKTFDDETLAELSASIAEHGLLQPIAVRPRASGGYLIVAGERRWRASRMAGLTEVPVIVKDVTDEQAMELALVENLQREDLDPVEEAAGIRELMDRCGLLPRKIIDLSPFHTSLFITNLASINTNSIFHHCYEFGTTGVFVSMGKPIANYRSGEYNKKMIPLSVVMDERICTGHEYALFWASVRRYLKHPELLEGKPTEENAYPAEECV